MFYRTTVKKKISYIIFIGYFFLCLKVQSQRKFEFDGQASLYSSYSPKNALDVFIGSRYLPQVNYTHPFKNERLLDFEASANLYGSVLFHPFDSTKTHGSINPYRLWGRYSGRQFEARIGLQKINFGTAQLLRALQWFDEVDPRDPLAFTSGVYGGLGRYYFLNNANIWAWILYGNKNPRGYELLKNNTDHPEFGGRIQYPVAKGEIAATYHHRNASSEDWEGTLPPYPNIRENRYALDGKWDVGVGVWFESVYIGKSKNVGMLTNQTFTNLGVDYTFGIGSGLGVSAEHLISTFDKKAFAFENSSNVTATSITYPLGFFNNISTMLYYAWDTTDFAYFLNYEHQFKKLTGYVMTYYNPKNQSIIGSAQIENSFSGPGIRFMLVYNH